MIREALVFVGVFALLIASPAAADDERDIVCEAFELSENDPFIASIKYEGTDARNAVWSIAEKAVHLEFISRIVIEAPARRLWSLCARDDVVHIELIGDQEKDSVLHRILELWRINQYIVGGRFNVSAFNFSQGVRKEAMGQRESAEKTLAEALESISRRLAPVFVAAGNTGTTDLNAYANGQSVFPVVATEPDGLEIYSGSSRPGQKSDPRRLFLFSDGAPRPPGGIDAKHLACESGDHLTIGQMLLPENARIDPGGSSFAAFAATAAACPVHQYLEVMNAYLSAGKAVGDVQLDPFVAYYVDNSVSPSCPALENRLADKRKQYAPIYNLRIPQKKRIQDMFFGNSMLFNLRYSTPLLRSFFESLPETSLIEGYEGAQRIVSQEVVQQRLSEMTFSDWLEIGGNKRSLYYPRWLAIAGRDIAPVLPRETIEQIAGYCQVASLFIVLPDDPPSPF